MNSSSAIELLNNKIINSIRDRVQGTCIRGTSFCTLDVWTNKVPWMFDPWTGDDVLLFITTIIDLLRFDLYHFLYLLHCLLLFILFINSSFPSSFVLHLLTFVSSPAVLTVPVTSQNDKQPPNVHMQSATSCTRRSIEYTVDTSPIHSTIHSTFSFRFHNLESLLISWRSFDHERLYWSWSLTSYSVLRTHTEDSFLFAEKPNNTDSQSQLLPVTGPLIM